MEIKDYLHLYIGCDVHESYNNRITKLIGVDTDSDLPVITLWEGKGRWIFPYDEVKLILRPLSDMTEEDLIAIYDADIIDGMNANQSEPSNRYKMNFVSMHLKEHKVTAMLCKLGYDLFGLIPAGLAIDKTSLKNETQS